MSDPMGSGRASAGEEAAFIAPGRPGVRSADGQLAAGHRPAGDLVAGAPGMTEHLQMHVVAPSPAALIISTADRPGPMADAVSGHNAMVRVQQMDQARASAPGFISQLGTAAPSPVPGPGAAEGIAAVDGGAPPHGVAARQGPGATYSREPKPS